MGNQVMLVLSFDLMTTSAGASKLVKLEANFVLGS